MDGLANCKYRARYQGLGWSYQATDTGADVEDSPEPGEVTALLLLSRVGHHDGALGAPE